MEESRRVADYFLVVGLPSDPAGQKILDETSLEVTFLVFFKSLIFSAEPVSGLRISNV